MRKQWKGGKSVAEWERIIPRDPAPAAGSMTGVEPATGAWARNTGCYCSRVQTGPEKQQGSVGWGLLLLAPCWAACPLAASSHQKTAQTPLCITHTSYNTIPGNLASWLAGARGSPPLAFLRCGPSSSLPSQLDRAPPGLLVVRTGIVEK